MMWLLLWFLVALFPILYSKNDGHQYASEVSLDILLQADENLANLLQQHLEKTTNEKVKEAIKRYVEASLQFSDAGNTGDPPFYHPINGYHFLKHVIHNWEEVDLALKQDKTASSEAFLNDMIETRTDAVYPTDKDLIYAAASIARMQYFFRLPFHTLVQGKIEDNTTGKVYQSIQPLNSWDCNEIGKGALKMDYNNSIQWLDIAKVKVEGGDTSIDIHTLKTNQNEAIAKLEVLNSPEKLAKERREYSELAEKPDMINRAKFIYRTAELLAPRMAALCRGESLTVNFKQPSISCKYFTRGDPFLLIGPLKMEELAGDPVIVMFHHFMMEKEMQRFIEISSSRLMRSEITKPQETWDMDDVMCRTSKQHWIQPEDDPKLEEKVTRRMEATTGLEMRAKTSTEFYQVVNYGIGGAVDLHVDVMFSGNKYTNLDDGDRIATFMIFLGNVTLGGSTVFPLLGLSVPPERGAGLFWFNTFSSGKEDILATHGGCPVLYGSKWVTNKFIRSFDQMFKFPCGLKFKDPIQLV